MQGAVTPVTTPPLETVAQGEELLHVPPLVVPINVMVEPTHTEVEPDIDANGAAFTVITLVAVAEPQLLLTV